MLDTSKNLAKQSEWLARRIAKDFESSKAVEEGILAYLMSRNQANPTRKSGDEKDINEMYLLCIRNEKHVRIRATMCLAFCPMSDTYTPTYRLREVGINNWIKKKGKHLLPRVCTKYGAQLGRKDDKLDYAEPNSIRLFMAVLDSGGYDNGDAYWGRGEPLWCANQDGAMCFTRAQGRMQAMVNLEIPWRCLVQPPRVQFERLKALIDSGNASAEQRVLFHEIEELRAS